MEYSVLNSDILSFISISPAPITPYTPPLSQQPMVAQRISLLLFLFPKNPTPSLHLSSLHPPSAALPLLLHRASSTPLSSPFSPLRAGASSSPVAVEYAHPRGAREGTPPCRLDRCSGLELEADSNPSPSPALSLPMSMCGDGRRARVTVEEQSRGASLAHPCLCHPSCRSSSTPPLSLLTLLSRGDQQAGGDPRARWLLSILVEVDRVD